MKNYLLTIFLILIIAFSLGCLNQGAEEVDNKIIVYATVSPQKEMIEAVGGDRVNVKIIVPQGGDPHNADLKPSQLMDLSQAKMYVMVGSGIEFEVKSMDKIKDLNKDMLVVDCSKGITLLENSDHDHEGEIGNDPHIWTSLKNGKIMVQNIYDGLVVIDPNNKAYYQENMNNYLKKIDDADRYIENELSGMENRSFMIFHPSWGYFSRDYNLTQIAIEIEGKEPTLQSLSNSIEEAKANNIKTIFIAPGFSSKAAEILINEIGGKTEVIDALAPNYIENLKITANKIKKQ
ncbi:MAG TPA: zinc ABC transporter substrate-binding protein [Methanofastidiosum sp.]|jgi:zinc transport system substrate-binding protein|nr:zinc ABC transporter substrate-binding protein [Methanofastidiosum sp.]HOC78315.1 zinc ABC transporter substrate-binding protein [Methanofastidiosum sp.]HPA49393.1 zinc ABC transporter substrate-binding protein [Methanofastidiosum sp.]HQK62956.1 zinc ABC transporter substrate-binding protein [Methanofastidiosum sp.]HQM95037.1 zinc ABC transporter substrate-binding protein [Methanofastidiosum sp.]